MRISRVDDASTTTVCVLVNCLLTAFYYCYKTVALILLIGSFLFVVFIELLQVVWAMLLSVHVGHFRLQFRTSLKILAIKIILVKSSLNDFFIIIVISNDRSPFLLIILKGTIEQELISLQYSFTMLLALRIVAFVILSISFLEPTLTVVFTIQNTTFIYCTIGLFYMAILISLLIVNEVSLVNVDSFSRGVIILKSSFTILLPLLEMPNIMVIILRILQIAVSIK